MSTDQLIADLQTALGSGLTSVVLYGSAAAGDFVDGVSGKDVLIVTKTLGREQLAAIAPALLKWQVAGNPLPQLLTTEELATSVDVFPIELADMHQSRKVLSGADVLSGITIDMGHLRMQVERELKTRLLMLRQRYLACAGQEPRVVQLMADSISTFLVLLRAAARLYNQAVPAEKAAALTELHARIPFDKQPFLDVLELKQNKLPAAATTADQLFERYLTSIEQVIRGVDRHLHADKAATSGRGPQPPKLE
jgi:hypothetical protein